MSIFKKGRKGQIGDLAFIVFTIASICITLILARYVYVKVDQGIKSTGMNTTQSDKVFNDMEVIFPMFDNMMLFIIIGLTIGIIMSSFMLPTHPMFMVLNIVGMIILVFLSMVLSNFFYDLQQQNDIQQVLLNTSGSLTSFDKTNFIMSKLPWICVIICFISTIVMYAKGRGEAGV